MLGTFVEVCLSAELDEDQLAALSSRIFNAITAVEKSMSFHDPASELSFVNANAHKRDCSISPALQEVIEQALVLSECSDGLFDITVANQLVRSGALPHHRAIDDIFTSPQANWKEIVLQENSIRFKKPLLIDLGGIAKGYAVDSAIAAIDDPQIEVAVNAGGDLRLSHWQGKHAHIKVPPSGLAECEVPMKNCALATSANYYSDHLFHHSAIVNPQRQQFVCRDDSVSVWASSCMLADALTKSAFLSAQGIHVAKQLGAEVVIIDPAGREHWC